VSLPPGEQADYDRMVSTTRAQFDETTFAAAWAEGQTMTLEQAIAYALNEGDSPTERVAQAP
jgi:hypothetical protein